LPAVPANDAQNEQLQTLALTIKVESVIVFRTESNFGCPAFSAYRPALSAQQTCALLSRFIV
jgi:hypothetical protein